MQLLLSLLNAPMRLFRLFLLHQLYKYKIKCLDMNKNLKRILLSILHLPLFIPKNVFYVCLNVITSVYSATDFLKKFAKLIFLPQIILHGSNMSSLIDENVPTMNELIGHPAFLQIMNAICEHLLSLDTVIKLNT